MEEGHWADDHVVELETWKRQRLRYKMKRTSRKDNDMDRERVGGRLLVRTVPVRPPREPFGGHKRSPCRRPSWPEVLRKRPLLISLWNSRQEDSAQCRSRVKAAIAALPEKLRFRGPRWGTSCSWEPCRKEPENDESPNSAGLAPQGSNRACPSFRRR